MTGKRDDDFDFTDIVPGASLKDQNKPEEPFSISYDDEVQTSYLLVNTLLNLLLKKGIVHQQEVNSLLAELHMEYKKGRRTP